MAGSGMFGVAAESLRTSHALFWTMIEIDEDFRNLQLINLMKGYSEIIKSPDEIIKSQAILAVDISPANSFSFKELKPGTEAWITYWKTHPEDQEAMLEWREQQLEKP